MLRHVAGRLDEDINEAAPAQPVGDDEVPSDGSEAPNTEEDPADEVPSDEPAAPTSGLASTGNEPND